MLLLKMRGAHLVSEPLQVKRSEEGDRGLVRAHKSCSISRSTSGYWKNLPNRRCSADGPYRPLDPRHTPGRRLAAGGGDRGAGEPVADAVLAAHSAPRTAGRDRTPGRD